MEVDVEQDSSSQIKVELPPGTAMVRVSDADLGAALDALVDNVFSHTREGTPFTMSVRRATGGIVEIAVTDDGPGMTSDALVERGASGAGSNGIGLDVVRRTSESAGGGLAIGQSPSGGARIVMRLPQATLSNS